MVHRIKKDALPLHGIFYVEKYRYIWYHNKEKYRCACTRDTLTSIKYIEPVHKKDSISL